MATIVTYLLKHWEIAKVIFLVYQIIKKTTFLSRNRSSDYKFQDGGQNSGRETLYFAVT